MPNIHFAVVAAPDKHREIVSKINNWKYDVEGKLFKGKCSPYITEMRMYDVRLPAEIEERFCRDFNLVNIEDYNAGAAQHGAPWKWKILKFFFRIARITTPYQKISIANGDHQYTIVPWYYAVCFGKLRRAPVKTELGSEREVM